MPLLHSTTAVPDGSLADAVAAAKPPLARPSDAAPSATEPTRMRQRFPWTNVLERVLLELPVLLAITGFPFRKTNNRPTQVNG